MDTEWELVSVGRLDSEFEMFPTGSSVDDAAAHAAGVLGDGPTEDVVPRTPSGVDELGMDAFGTADFDMVTNTTRSRSEGEDFFNPRHNGTFQRMRASDASETPRSSYPESPMPWSARGGPGDAPLVSGESHRPQLSSRDGRPPLAPAPPSAPVPAPTMPRQDPTPGGSIPKEPEPPAERACSVVASATPVPAATGDNTASTFGYASVVESSHVFRSTPSELSLRVKLSRKPQEVHTGDLHFRGNAREEVKDALPPPSAEPSKRVLRFRFVA